MINLNKDQTAITVSPYLFEKLSNPQLQKLSNNKDDVVFKLVHPSNVSEYFRFLYLEGRYVGCWDMKEGKIRWRK